MFMSDIVAGWRDAVNDRLEQLICLEEGWDGYAGIPVSFVNAKFSFHMLESICRPDTPAPQIVPGPSGDLQIEWHASAGDIELWVRGPNDVHAWRGISETQECEELNLTTDFSAVADWVKQITEPRIAIAAA
jgi:hypothetical protein